MSATGHIGAYRSYQLTPDGHQASFNHIPLIWIIPRGQRHLSSASPLEDVVQVQPFRRDEEGVELRVPGWLPAQDTPGG